MAALISKRCWMLFGVVSFSWLGCGSSGQSAVETGPSVGGGSSSFEGPSAGSVSVVGFAGSATTGGAASIGDMVPPEPIVAGAPDDFPCTCDSIECPSGSRPAVSQGCSCPNYCAPDATCLRASDLYNAVRDSVVAAPSSTACSTDADCVTLVETNACIACGYQAVAKQAADTVLQVLTNEAQEDCGYCPADTAGCQPPAGGPGCISGVCTFGSGLLK